ncbi:hypothetical protein [Shimia abyssi]|uniref:Invasion protein IalB n=1 Tax=Shimia abyssi TaxID=1662395 RepID=A0A2P8FD63_9RHOB|nr:hypothetical protein [Shimia abyssi]PSL19608.1 hypothetical protein CLV88_10530 [Shimia abyssi]
MRWLLPLLLSVPLAVPLSAQDREGNDTPGEWVVTHFEPFGIWTSICDERPDNGALSQRCYIRWVDVFSRAPKFAGQFVFITPEPNGPKVDFGMEPGTIYDPDGFRITSADDTIIWSTQRGGCLTGLACTFSGDDATPLVDAMQTGDAFRFTFTDRHGAPRNLTWPLKGFAPAYEDFVAQSDKRNLP